MSGQVPTIWWSMPLLVHPFVAFRDGLDQARKERPHLEAVVEAERLLAAVGGREADADVAAFAFDRGDELRRDVMGVDVDGQFGAPCQQDGCSVMPGLDPGIHRLRGSAGPYCRLAILIMDCRVKPGNDAERVCLVHFLSRSRSISDFSWPPSTSIMVPLTMCISGEASMTTRFATSSTSAMRPIGIEDGASLSASS